MLLPRYLGLKQRRRSCLLFFIVHALSTLTAGPALGASKYPIEPCDNPTRMARGSQVIVTAFLWITRARRGNPPGTTVHIEPTGLYGFARLLAAAPMALVISNSRLRTRGSLIS